MLMLIKGKELNQLTIQKNLNTSYVNVNHYSLAVKGMLNLTFKYILC